MTTSLARKGSSAILKFLCLAQCLEKTLQMAADQMNELSAASLIQHNLHILTQLLPRSGVLLFYILKTCVGCLKYQAVCNVLGNTNIEDVAQITEPIQGGVYGCVCIM